MTAHILLHGNGKSVVILISQLAGKFSQGRQHFFVDGKSVQRSFDELLLGV